MGKLSNDQDGLGAIEALLVLVIVAMVGFTGWYVWHAQQTSNKNYAPTSSGNPTFKKRPKTTSSSSTSTSSINTTPSASSSTEKAAAVTAIEADCVKTSGFKSCSAVIEKTEGDFVYASVHDTTPGGAGTGYNSIAQMGTSGNWTVEWSGQMAPTQAEAQKYGFPADWGPYQ